MVAVNTLRASTNLFGLSTLYIKRRRAWDQYNISRQPHTILPLASKYRDRIWEILRDVSG